MAAMTAPPANPKERPMRKPMTSRYRQQGGGDHREGRQARGENRTLLKSRDVSNIRVGALRWIWLQMRTATGDEGIHNGITGTSGTVSGQSATQGSDLARPHTASRHRPMNPCNRRRWPYFVERRLETRRRGSYRFASQMARKYPWSGVVSANRILCHRHLKEISLDLLPIH